MSLGVYYPRQHVLPEFDAESIFGEGGLRLRQNIEQCAGPSLHLCASSSLSRHPRMSRLRRYDFDTHHLAFKQYGAGIDNFAFGIEPLSLLLWWGDLAAARAGFAKVPRSPTKRGTTRDDQW